MSLAFALVTASADIRAHAMHRRSEMQIVDDYKNKAIRIFIRGREVLTVDSTGVHVRRDIDTGRRAADGSAP